MLDKFTVSVAVAIFAKTSNDSALPTKCAFYDKDGKIYLPNAPLTQSKYAHEVAIDIVKVILPVDLRLLTIVPIGFFDPVLDDPIEKANREVLLGYKIIVSPGMPIHSELEFKDYDDLRISLTRISSSHFRLFKLGLTAR